LEERIQDALDLVQNLKQQHDDLLEDIPLEAQTRPNDEDDTTLTFKLVNPTILFAGHGIKKLPLQESNVAVNETSSPQAKIFLFAVMTLIMFSFGYIYSKKEKFQGGVYSQILVSEAEFANNYMTHESTTFWKN